MSTVEFVQIEPTTRCNFKCPFCPRTNLPLGDMEYGLFSQVLKMFPDIRYLQLYGEGEPFLYPAYFSMIMEAVGRDIKVSTISNGSLLHKHIPSILASGLNSVHISLESINPDTFHTIRGGDLAQVLDNIKLLVDTRNKNKSLIPFVGFSITVLKETSDDLDQIFKKYQELDMDGGIIIQPLNEMSSYAKNYDATVNSQALENADLKRIDDELENNTILKKIRNDRRLDFTYFEALRHNFSPRQDGCPWLKRSLFVNHLGHVMPCSMVKNVDLYAFGHIGRDSRQSILQKREAMRNEVMAGHIPEACRNCRTLDPRYKPGKMHQYFNETADGVRSIDK